MGNKINPSDVIPFQVISYYIFQKKIEKIINEGVNPFLNGGNKPIVNEAPIIKTPLNGKEGNETARNELKVDVIKDNGKKCEEIKCYVLSPENIRLWKSLINYDKIKPEFENTFSSFKFEGKDIETEFKNKLKETYKNLVNNGTIDEPQIQDIKSSFKENFEFTKIFTRLKYIKNDILECLIDQDIYSLINEYNIASFVNVIQINMIINDRMIIIKKYKKIKYIYRGFCENEIKLNQITSEFKSSFPYNCTYEDLQKKDSNDIISNLFDATHFKKMECKGFDLANETLIIKYLTQELKDKIGAKIDLKNINYSKFNVRLSKFDYPPYLNAVFQTLFHLEPLTKYLLTESNYNLIKDKCDFTYYFCLLLLYINQNNNKEPLPLEDLNEKIYMKESKFKYDKECLPGDLFEFLIFQMKEEISSLYSTTNQIKNNIKSDDSIFIQNTFYYTKGTMIECKSCKNKDVNFENLCILKVSLDTALEKGKKRNNQDLIELYLQQLTELISFPDEICKKCKKKSEITYQTKFYVLPKYVIFLINKINNFDKFNYIYKESLELSPFINKDSKYNNKNTKYKLKAVISTDNNKKDYYSFCRQKTEDGKEEWYKYNDLDISKVREKEVLKQQNVCLLIYESDNNIKVEENKGKNAKEIGPILPKENEPQPKQDNKPNNTIIKDDENNNSKNNTISKNDKNDNKKNNELSSKNTEVFEEMKNKMKKDKTENVENKINDNENKTNENKINENKINENKINENKINENKIDENKINDNKINENKINENKINDDENKK